MVIKYSSDLNWVSRNYLIRKKNANQSGNITFSGNERARNFRNAHAMTGSFENFFYMIIQHCYGNTSKQELG